MDLRNCFVEHTGNVWRIETLILASARLKTFRFYLDNISLNDPITWRLANVRDATFHFNRVNSADLSVPIVLRSDGCIMDGWHRVIKAIVQKRKYILARQFVKNPPPDFILPKNNKNVLRV